MPIEELTYITVQCLDLATAKHTLLDMPSVSLSNRYVVIHPQVRHFLPAFRALLTTTPHLGHHQRSKPST
jgi:hypothetical protein